MRSEEEIRENLGICLRELEEGRLTKEEKVIWMISINVLNWTLRERPTFEDSEIEKFLEF